jgi:flagellum-specific ATP synthase
MTPANVADWRERVMGVLNEPEKLRFVGRVTRVVGLSIEAILPACTVGASCSIRLNDGGRLIAEIVGFRGSTALLMPIGEVAGVRDGAVVELIGSSPVIPVGDAMLGRVLGPMLEPMDGGPSLLLPHRTLLWATPPVAMLRRRIHKPMTTGVRSIDTFTTFGEGQRIGIFAGAGVGKSTLLGMLARQADADVVVVGLIGERGREVREFIERDLGPAGLARTVLVVATGDAPPVARVRAAASATAIAEYFRRRGKRVLLMMDSLTRVSMAQREIGLAAGEPPTSKGYPPSVFTLMPRLLERAGNDEGQGSITGLYTVLVEGDDLSDPIADSARSILDGHVVLSRALANAGHFPAVDVLGSVSRVMNDITSEEHRKVAASVRELMATHKEASDMIEIGAYQKGSNPRIDRAIHAVDPIRTFLRQRTDERTELPEALERAVQNILQNNVEVRA